MQQPRLSRLTGPNKVGQSEVLIRQVRRGEWLTCVREGTSDVEDETAERFERVFEVRNLWLARPLSDDERGYSGVNDGKARTYVRAVVLRVRSFQCSADIGSVDHRIGVERSL